jgi:hypothetical protein
MINLLRITSKWTTNTAFEDIEYEQFQQGGGQTCDQGFYWLSVDLAVLSTCQLLRLTSRSQARSRNGTRYLSKRNLVLFDSREIMMHDMVSNSVIG